VCVRGVLLGRTVAVCCLGETDVLFRSRSGLKVSAWVNTRSAPSWWCVGKVLASPAGKSGARERFVPRTGAGWVPLCFVVERPLSLWEKFFSRISSLLKIVVSVLARVCFWTLVVFKSYDQSIIGPAFFLRNHTPPATTRFCLLPHLLWNFRIFAFALSYLLSTECVRQDIAIRIVFWEVTTICSPVHDRICKTSWTWKWSKGIIPSVKTSLWTCSPLPLSKSLSISTFHTPLKISSDF